MEYYNYFALIGMILCHIIDDYYLQGVLASMKQRKWWEDNAPEPMYKYDYLVTLFMHSFSWTCAIMLIPTVYVLVFGGKWYPLLFIWNLAAHYIIDDMKANKKIINLVVDQGMHMVQVIVTWLLFFVA